MKKPFNIEEFNMLAVVSDLLCKGEVETRIAKYMHEKRWSEKRVQRFLEKCMLSEQWYKRIWGAYRGYKSLPLGSDAAQHLGESLKRTSFFCHRTTLPMPPEDQT